MRHLPRIASRVPTYVRINQVDSADGEIDLDLVALLHPHGVVLPKVEAAAQVRVVAERLSGAGADHTTILPMIESAQGLLNVNDIAQAATGHVQTLMLGTADLVADLGVTLSEDERELMLARSIVVVAARAAQLAEPIDGPVLNLDEKSFEDSCLVSRRLGFGARVCLTPGQARDAARAYTSLDRSTHQRLAALVTAFQEARRHGASVTRVGNTFVDPPVYEAAQRAMRRHETFLQPTADH
jgi:citrate lyase subunit beta/citryl-CoA lyase